MTTPIASVGDDWLYKVLAPGDSADYSAWAYDDSAWDEGPGGFANEADTGVGLPTANTIICGGVSPISPAAQIVWLRKHLGPLAESDLELAIYHDDGVQVWFNGAPVTLSTVSYYVATATVDAAQVNIAGDNIIAIKVTDSVPSGTSLNIYAGGAVVSLDTTPDAIPGGDDVTAAPVYFLKFEAPAGDVRLAEGGMLTFNSEVYLGEHPVFGAIHTPDTIEAGFGDIGESGMVVFAPNGTADVADWWRADLFDCRLRIWMGFLDTDEFTVADTPTLLADMLVDTYERQQNMGGEELLAIELVPRAEKLFLRNEGNACNTRFHQTVWPGEQGFDNCTDLTGYLAWGAESPPRSA